MIALQKSVREKREKCAQEVTTVRPLLQFLIQRTKGLQVEVSAIIFVNKFHLLAYIYLLIFFFYL